ncbi:MAG: fibronectin type III domain-containing protein, partial [Bacteroidales bacterium]|nr:fibronectin type III domain-containing protein [Bacteroidales bacterium]
TMTKKSYTITKLTPDNHGTITGQNTVDYGENAAYTITPSAGYLIDNVLVDGMSVGAVSSYIFHNVTANHTISATFKKEICIVPTSLHAENVDSTSATLAWYHPGADSYDIQYKNINDPTWTLVQNVPGFAYSLTNLQPNTYYVFQVKANCGNGNESGWSNGFTFKTPAVVPQVGVADYVKDHVKVYAEHNRVHIINDFAVEIENVAIYDMYGKLIYSGNAINNPEVIELNVAIGTYVVRLNTVQGPAVYKVHINR